MPLRHLVVTPLPNGRTANTAFLSVHLGPRLREPGVLGDYPDFRDWGTFLAAAPAMQFTVLLDGVARPAGAVSIASATPTAVTWRALFGPPASSNLEVSPHVFLDRTNLDLTSVSSAAITDLLAPIVKAQTLKGTAGPITQAEIAPLAGDLGAVAADLRAFVSSVGNGQEPTSESYEFHQILHMLAAHPQLMRALGLVFDLQVTMPAGAVGEVQVTTNWAAKAGMRPHDEVPMRVQVDANFRPLVGDPAYRTPGWLALGGSKYRVVQLDTVNAATQLGHLDRQLVNVTDPTAPIDVPAVIEAGISIAHLDLAPVLTQRTQRARLIEDQIDDYVTKPNPPAPILIAEDLTLGHRIDAEDIAAPGFRSLHQRHALDGYRFPRNTNADFTPTDDEGWSQIALMTDGSVVRPSTSTAVVYTVEGGPNIAKSERRDDTAWRVLDFMATWAGWSLSAQRPGSVADPAGNPLPAATSAPTPSDEAKTQINYQPVPDTLPRLRYGHTYRMRARTVDLAGNGPSLADNPDTTIPQAIFGRTLPVPPPTTLYRQSRPDPGVGVAANTLVILSELTQADGTVAPTDRLLFPPRISQARLERHDLPNGGVDPASYAEIVTRDAASLAGQCLVDPETNDLVAGAAISNGAVTAGPLKSAVTYLADPMVRGIAFHGLPAAASGAPVIMAAGAWPTLEAVDLELRAGTAAPTSSVANRRVTVRLPKGTTFDIEVSCAPVTARLGHMAAYNALTSTEAASIATAANNGQVLTISARESIRLVHAVRIPLAPPSFSSMTASRTVLGQTSVLFDGVLSLHRATTDRTTLNGEWTDQIDPVAEAGPRAVTHRAVVGDVLIPEGGPAATADVDDLGFEFGDPRRRSIELSMEGFCRYSRYFTQRLDTTMPAPGSIVLSVAGVSEPTVVVTNLVTGQVYERNVDYTINRTAGSIARVSALTIPDGTSLRIEYIPLPVSRLSSEAATGGTIVVDVPSASPPASPVVRAIVPAFARTITETATSITVDHDGRVLRALIERPWYSSGSGELLGVATDLASVATPSLTRWGRDPIWSGSGPTVRPANTSFPRAAESMATADGRFHVAGHEVTFDAERKVWTADVLIDANFGYRPWVQLSLCRLQPLAVDLAHVSDPVQCEPVRLGASRTLTVVKGATGQATVTMTGRDANNTVKVTTQIADPTISDPDLKWINVATVALVRSGTTAAASFTGTITLPAAVERRIIVEDSEPVKIESAGVLVSSRSVAYRDVVTIPVGW